MEEYPTFGVDENGQIVSDMPDDYGLQGEYAADPDHDSFSGPKLPAEEEAEGGQLSDDEELPAEAEGAVPDDEEIQQPDTVLSSPLLLDIQEDIARIVQAQASTEGYLSTSALDVFDRVVSGYDYNYYCAFRYDSDSYNAIMYLADDISSSGSSVVLEGAVSVRLYRIYNSSTRTYTYHYLKSDAGDVSISLSDGLMYYTNCAAGYPTLGSVPAPSKYSPSVILLCGAAVFTLLIGIFRRKRNV